MCRLMTAAAARDERNLALLALPAHNNIARIELFELPRAGFHKTLDHFLFDVFDFIDDFLHDENLPDMKQTLLTELSRFLARISIARNAMKFK